MCQIIMQQHTVRFLEGITTLLIFFMSQNLNNLEFCIKVSIPKERVA